MKTTRKALSEIYPIVCSTWQNKIDALLNENKFNEEIEVSKALINSAYQSVEKEQQKEWLEKNLPKPESIADKIKDYSSACKILGIKELTLKTFDYLKNEGKAIKAFALHKVTTGIEAINEGWKPDFENEDEYKYYIYMLNKKRGSSFGVVGRDVSSYGLGDLYIESREKAEAIARIFESEYKIILF